MVELLLDPFTCEVCGFMQRALLAGILAGIAAALVGTWVVLRGLSFMGDAVAHGVLPGIAVAYLMGGSLVLGGAVGAGVMILAIAWVGRRSRLGDDAAIGLLFVGMLALGVVIVSREGAYAGDLTAFLFGDAVGVTSDDVVVAGVAVVVTLVATVLLYRPFLAVTFNRDTAELLGMRPELAHGLQLALMAGVVVASFRTVGTLLVFALLVAPPAAAAQITRGVPAMMAVASGIATVSVAVGLLVSFHLGTAGSATIALVAVLAFVVVVLARDLRLGRSAARA